MRLQWLVRALSTREEEEAAREPQGREKVWVASKVRLFLPQSKQ